MFDSSDSFHSCLRSLPSADAGFQEEALLRQGMLTKPKGSLGRLEDIAVWLAGWQETDRPVLDRISALLFAGNHGIVAENISSFPASVTKQMVENFERGGAAINALTAVFGHELRVVPVELDRPTGNFALEAAMSEAETLSALNIGARAVNECDADLIYFGEMGIGNTTCASTLAGVVFGGTGADWAGPGTGLPSDRVAHKATVIDRALKLHRAECVTTFDIMRLVGGRELAAIMGGIVAARMKRTPVLLDGFVVTAAAAPLILSGVETMDHCLSAHCSAEPGHQRLLDCLWMEPLLKLEMRLGEGSGAALACELVKAAVATHNNMATFDEAEISKC